MTDNEIIKALECCSIDGNCCYCPYFCGNLTCMDKRDKDALNLINRQKAEIERLSSERLVHKKIIDDRAEAILQHDAVIRDLHKQLKDVGQIKSEAIKEFAERLKELKRNSTMDRRIYTAEMIDSLVKEMG